MSTGSITINRDARSELQNKKYTKISANEFSVTSQLAVARQRMWMDWESLKQDNYLKDNARFRLRRFSYIYFLPATGEIVPFPAMPYFQSSDLNSYAGGIQREFAPLLDSTLTNKFLHELIRVNFRQFPVNLKKTQQPWKLDVHQVRVVATPDVAGLPTPEGIHHDENDFVCIHLANRENAVGGVNGIYDNNRNLLESCTLDQPMDSIIVWDPEVMHGVSPIHPQNPNERAVRDILLIGYSHEPGLERPEPSLDHAVNHFSRNTPVLSQSKTADII